MSAPQKTWQLPQGITLGNAQPLVLIAGPCALETYDHAMYMADALQTLCARLKLPLIYKTSFDKANRTSLSSERGVGLEAALPVFDALRQRNLPVITDVHTPQQCALVAPHVDVLQIPAFLCRQTDLLLAAAATNKPINVKKGQFCAPADMQHVVAKITHAGNTQVSVCERGVCFGYNTLVTDFRAIPQMRAACGDAPVVFDATHSVQQPSGANGKSGGQRQFVATLARAAVSVGVAAVFIETHQDPDNAPSDGPNMVPLAQLEALLQQLMQFDALAKALPVL
jgi:2-dehydro-3-deoxyphosphooctonate aldolase (KDO 8-P synthase)